jgi:hypothetical protein
VTPDKVDKEIQELEHKTALGEALLDLIDETRAPYEYEFRGEPSEQDPLADTMATLLFKPEPEAEADSDIGAEVPGHLEAEDDVDDG